MIEFVSATRGSLAAFKQTPLGQSLGRFSEFPGVTARITLDNTRGLPLVYNEAISASTSDILVFVHDDVFILDPFIADRLEEALDVADVVGIVGNAHSSENQVTWFTGEPKSLSGALWVGDALTLLTYGKSPRRAAVLDGLFLAVKTSTLRGAGVRFDPRFDFHMYDVDFCRSCRNADLRLSTWPIVVSHRSFGDYDTPQWQAARDVYLAKWGSASPPLAD